LAFDQPKTLVRITALFDYITKRPGTQEILKGHRQNGKTVLSSYKEALHYMTSIFIPNLIKEDRGAQEHDIALATMSATCSPHMIQYHDYFNELDVDQSGVVDLEEFTLIGQRFEVPLTISLYKAAFSFLDVDEDGYIQFGEIQAGMKAYNSHDFAHMIRVKEDMSYEDLLEFEAAIAGQGEQEPSFMSLLEEPTETLAIGEPASAAHSPQSVKSDVPSLDMSKTHVSEEASAKVVALKPREKKALKGQTRGRINPKHPVLDQDASEEDVVDTQVDLGPGLNTTQKAIPKLPGSFTVQIYEDQVETLHNVFDHYAAIGFKQGRERKLRLAQFLALLKDAGLVLDTRSQEDAKILYIEATSLPGSGSKTRNTLMDFGMFTYSLSRLAFQHIGTKLSVMDAVDKLLEHYIFPNAETKKDILSKGIAEEGKALPGSEIDALIIAGWKGSTSALETLVAARVTNVSVPALNVVFNLFLDCIKSIFLEFSCRDPNPGDQDANTIESKAMDQEGLRRFVTEFNVLGRVNMDQIDMAFRTAAETHCRDDKEDKVSYFGDMRPDCISFKAFNEFLLRCALLQGQHPAYNVLNPAQKLDVLMQTLAQSQGMLRLCKKLRGTELGKQLSEMEALCITSNKRNKDPEVHIWNVDDVKEALGPEAEGCAQQIFDFYASFGQPTRIDVMGSGKLEKFVRDTKIYEVLDPDIPHGTPTYELAINQRDLDILFKQNMLSAKERITGEGKPAVPVTKYDRITVAGPTNGAIDFRGFLFVISDIAPVKYPCAEDKKDALKLLWDSHIMPLAKMRQVKAETEEENLQNPPIRELMGKVEKQLRAYFKMYSLPVKTLTGMVLQSNRDLLLKFFRDFEVHFQLGLGLGLGFSKCISCGSNTPTLKIHIHVIFYPYFLLQVLSQLINQY